jgi:hypothetical protein
MSMARSITLGLTRTAQRRNVLVLTFALCVWLFAYATHLHAADGHDGQQKPVCNFCLTLPASAAPPPVLNQVAPLVFDTCGRVCDRVAAISTRDVPSFYSSRAPPSL